jgi:hypothetical protein
VPNQTIDKPFKPTKLLEVIAQAISTEGTPADRRQ